MKTKLRLTTVIIGLMAGAMIVTVASAFVITNTLPRSSAAGAAARAPGQMVNAGAARHQARLADFASQPVITETAPPSVGSIFFPEAVEIIFDGINQAVELLINVLFIRAGFDPPFLPQLPDIPDPDEMESNENELNENNTSTEKSRLSLTQRSLHRISSAE